MNCLVIIDVQKGFLYEKTDFVPEKIKELLSKHKFDCIVATQYKNVTGSPCDKQLNWKQLFDEDSQTLNEYVKSVAEKVFIKNAYSCFTEEFETYIREKGIDKLYFVGIDTDCCVLGSIYDAFDKGYDYGIYDECCASCGGKENHDAAITVFKRAFGKQHIYKI